MSNTDRNALARRATATLLLACLPLLAATRVYGLPVVRSSLDGFTVAGQTLDLDEAALGLATLRGRVRAALAFAGARLRTLYRLEGRFQVAYRLDGNGHPAAFIALTLAGEDIAPRDEERAVQVVVDELREAQLAAGGAGRLQATARMFG